MRISKLMAALLAVIIATACSSENKSEAQGGIEGGGGGTLIANAVGKYRIHQVVKDHKTDLRLILKTLSNVAYGQTGTKLYGGPKTIIDVLDEADIEVLDDRPCLDSAGTEVDGSIHASRPNMICISAFTIAPKVIEERVKTEVLALLIHELSHFLGTTEIEARDFQSWAAALLSRVGAQDADNFLKALLSANEMLSLEFRSMIERAEVASGEQLYDQAFNVLDLQSKIKTFTQNHLNIHDPREEELFDAYSMLTWVTMDYARSLGSDEFAKEAKRDYDELFEEKESITLADFLKAKGFSPNMYGDKIIIPKIDSRAELKQELERLRSYYLGQEEIARAIIFGLPIPPFSEPGEVTINPWQDFIGDYEVIEKKCTGTSSMVGFKIEDQKGRLVMIERWINGSSTRPLQRGEHDVWGVVDVGGEKTKAWRSVEQGNLWGDSYQKLVQSLETTSVGLEMKSHSISKSAYGGDPKYSEASCLFKLKKI